MPDKIIRKSPPIELVGIAWERQPDEPYLAYEYFSRYLQLKEPHRNVYSLAKIVGRPATSLYQIYYKWRWEERCGQYLNSVEKQKEELRKELREKMHEDHAKLAQEMLDKARQGLAFLDAGTMSANDISKMADIAVKIERLSRGESTEKVEQENKGTIQVLHERGLVDSILSNKDASELACKLFEQLENVNNQDVNEVNNNEIIDNEIIDNELIDPFLQSEQENTN